METLGHLCQACHHVHFDPSILSVLIHEKVVMTYFCPWVLNLKRSLWMVIVATLCSWNPEIKWHLLLCCFFHLALYFSYTTYLFKNWSNKISPDFFLCWCTVLSNPLKLSCAMLFRNHSFLKILTLCWELQTELMRKSLFWWVFNLELT